MELNEEHFRALMYYNFLRGLSASECKSEFDHLLGTVAPSYSGISRWYREFRLGRLSLSDGPRAGRPLSAVTEENIEAARVLIAGDPRITFEEIEVTLSIGSAAAQEIVFGHLKLKKVLFKWVPHSLSDVQKKARLDWCVKMLKNYENGKSKRLFEIVTGDETWIYFYDPPLPQQNMIWVSQSDGAPTQSVNNRSCLKRMFALFSVKAVSLHMLWWEHDKQ